MRNHVKIVFIKLMYVFLTFFCVNFTHLLQKVIFIAIIFMSVTLSNLVGVQF